MVGLADLGIQLERWTGPLLAANGPGSGRALAEAGRLVGGASLVVALPPMAGGAPAALLAAGWGARHAAPPPPLGGPSPPPRRPPGVHPRAAVGGRRHPPL